MAECSPGPGHAEMSEWMPDPLLIPHFVSTRAWEGSVFIPISLTQTQRLRVFGEVLGAMPPADPAGLQLQLCDCGGFAC